MRKTTIEEIIAAAGGSLIQRAPGPEAQAITGVNTTPGKWKKVTCLWL